MGFEGIMGDDGVVEGGGIAQESEGAEKMIHAVV